jgi:hypothetical protein
VDAAHEYPAPTHPPLLDPLELPELEPELEPLPDPLSAPELLRPASLPPGMMPPLPLPLLPCPPPPPPVVPLHAATTTDASSVTVTSARPDVSRYRTFMGPLSFAMAMWQWPHLGSMVTCSANTQFPLAHAEVHWAPHASRSFASEMTDAP